MSRISSLASGFLPFDSGGADQKRVQAEAFEPYGFNGLATGVSGIDEVVELSGDQGGGYGEDGASQRMQPLITQGPAGRVIGDGSPVRRQYCRTYRVDGE